MSGFLPFIVLALFSFGVGYAIGYRQAKRGLPFIPSDPKL